MKKNRRDEKRRNVFVDEVSNLSDKQKKISSKWGSDRISESNKRWDAMTPEEQREVLEECSDIFEELAEHIGEDPENEDVQKLMIRWHEFIRNFYEPSIEVLRCLGLMYVYDEEFANKFREIDPNLPDYLEKTVNSYVNILEDKWLESQYQVLEQ